MDQYDLGFICPTGENRALKLTINNFRGQWYLHIREYFQDLDTSNWFPTKKGIAIKAEYADILTFMLQDSERLFSSIFRNEVRELIDDKQLDLFKDYNATME